MKHSSSKLIRGLVAVAAFAAIAIVGSKAVSADRGGLDPCPTGWSLVTPPRNPVLLCLPDRLVIDLGEDEAPPEAGCPEGWNQVTPPLNPVLGCLPGTVVQTDVPRLRSVKPDGTCPEGWRPATPPLNPVLGCLPDTFYLKPGPDGRLGQIPDGQCPDGWYSATPPLNPMLLCLPGRLTSVPPSGPPGGR